MVSCVFGVPSVMSVLFLILGRPRLFHVELS